MDVADIDSNEPAPPPYSQDEFDSKVELARQVSILDAQAGSRDPPPPPQVASDSQQHLLYPSQSAPTAHSIPSPSSGSNPRRARRPLPVPNLGSGMVIPPPPPLSNQFRPMTTDSYADPQSHSSKERPRWYAQAGLDSSSGSSSSVPAAQSSSPPRAQMHSLDQVPTRPDDERDSPLGHELPPFEPIGPSLEGPAYSIHDNASDTTEETEPVPPPVQFSPVPRRVDPHNLLAQATPVIRSRSPYGTRNPAFSSPPPNAAHMMGYNPRPEQISRPSAANRVLNPSAFYNASVSSVIIPQSHGYPAQSFQNQRGQPSHLQRPTSSGSNYQYLPPSGQHYGSGGPDPSFNPRQSTAYPPHRYNNQTPTPPANSNGYQPYNNSAGYATWHN